MPRTLVVWVGFVTCVAVAHEPPSGEFQGPGWVCPEEGPFSKCDDGPFGVPGLQGDPADIGSWQFSSNWPVQATHAVVLATGNVLIWRGTYIPTTLYVYDPETDDFVAQTNASGGLDLFCAGHCVLADGRVAIVGGELNEGPPAVGQRDLNIYNPFTNKSSNKRDMTFGRWYPTATTLADGRLLATSGYKAPDENGPRGYVRIPELYDPETNKWTLLFDAEVRMHTYPFMFVLPDERILMAGPDSCSTQETNDTRVLDLATGEWENVAVHTHACKGSAVMIRPGVVLKTGGGNPARNRAEVLDMTVAQPSWRAVESTHIPRRRHDLTMLPDSNVIAVGGTRAGEHTPDCRIQSAEIWDSQTERWTVVASSSRSRMYHSTTVLLPDGRVLTAGGENCGSDGMTNVDEQNGEIYSPPYLFRGPRPVIGSAPSEVGYGETFRVNTQDANSIEKVALVRPGAVTHGFDQNQRYVPLTFSKGSGRLNVNAPDGGGVAPPGYYMLFIVDSAGIPSVAEFVRVDTCSGNCSGDSDDDGIPDSTDNCPEVANSGQSDHDQDGLGNACDPDDDGDGIPDSEDNCPRLNSSNLQDVDNDGLGDVCDDDDDNDGVVDAKDNCRTVPNGDQADLDGDADGDVCDVDDDGDGVIDTDDNCPLLASADVADLDSDGEGDACDVDDDGDDIPDAQDNCPRLPNTDQQDLDGEGLGDVCDPDDDNDGFDDTSDNCPRNANADQVDTDSDGLGNLCDHDDDGDGVEDGQDNCALIANGDQDDADDDGIGNVCDDDGDNDTVADGVDNCPNLPNADQADADADGIGDLCDLDQDNDGWLDNFDNCMEIPNATQSDLDGDSIGDLCDDDDDNDSIPDGVDNCVTLANPEQGDLDVDGLGDLCDSDVDGDNVDNEIDNCVRGDNPKQSDFDEDGVGDVCDDDDDNDGVNDEVDNCPQTRNASQADFDDDGLGDPCDTDDDGDGAADDVDNCPQLENPEQRDRDADGLGDACDKDGDNDSIPDTDDNCPLVANEDQLDADGDGTGDVCDNDDDNDNVSDVEDNCTRVPNEQQTDTDGDQLGDACDDDLDGDAIENSLDNCPQDANEDQEDTDGDGFGNACEEPRSDRLFLRGDANQDGRINITDGLFVLNYLFLGGPEPSCMEAANFSDGFELDIATPVYLFRALFVGDVQLQVPFEECGADPTPTGMGCESYSLCKVGES